MKKTFLASVMFAAFGMGIMNAKPSGWIELDEAKFFKYVVSYTTERVGDCEIKYKVTTKYFFGKPISSCKQLISKTCGNPGGGTGSNSNKSR